MPEGERLVPDKSDFFGGEWSMPWPSPEIFEETARAETWERQPGPIDEQDWPFVRDVENKKNAYYRMRYRGAHWPWRTFHPDEPLAEEPDKQMEQFLQKGYWAPAVDAALKAYETTDDPRFRQVAVCAAGLHIADVIEKSRAFLDPALSGDGLVATKHFLIFSHRVHEVSQLDMDEAERQYFDPLRFQFHMAFVELAAYDPIRVPSLLDTFDPAVKETGEWDYFDKARSSLVNLTYLSEEQKIAVVERLKRRAADSIGEEMMHPQYFMENLHLFGLAHMPDFYQPGSDDELKWWKLTAEEIMHGNVSRLKDEERFIEVTYGQEPLF